MKNFILALILVSPLFVFAQDNKSQSIELPDFVITGVQTVNLPIAKKEKASFVPILSKDFFLPQYSPEELPLAQVENPIDKKIDLWKNLNSYNGNLYFGLGGYTLPIGKFFLGQNFNNYFFSLDVFGSNTKDYLPYSSYNVSGATIKNEFYINTTSAFLPGLRIYLNGNFLRDSYNFYASNNPAVERRTNNGNIELGINNSLSRFINYNAKVSASQLLINENGFREIKFNSLASFIFKFPYISFGATFDYLQQNVKNGYNNNADYYFYKIEPKLKINTLENLIINTGLNYSSSNNNNFFSPFGSIELTLNKNFLMTASFLPHVEFNTHREFIASNIYYNISKLDNLFTKYKIDLNTALKYQYYKYFEIGFSAAFEKIDNYFYFEDNIEQGKFNINKIDDVTMFGLKLDLLFHPGPYGKFYGEAAYQTVENNSKQIIPYKPYFNTSLNYSYSFAFGLDVAANYKMSYKYYTNIQNTDEILFYHNISLTAAYNIFENLQLKATLENLLNRKNYLWKNYQDKPFDVIIAVEYKW
ncbi:hypothetical protein ABRY23_00655 [Melioribacteraceae bacterium 4301-Me]|uniref:hypothetical protein n=1 Tax=Pyranulibacter aquaticus TaxID=3163344 RepID=UPI0035969048